MADRTQKNDNKAKDLGINLAHKIIQGRNKDIANGYFTANKINKNFSFKDLPKVPDDKIAELGPKRTNGVLLAEGDSWFDYPRTDILSILGDFYGFEIETVAKKGHKIEDMAYSDGQLYTFIQRLESVIRRGDVPRAILLSGGGNDIAGPELSYILNHASSPTPGLNTEVLRGVINQRLRHSYLIIISAVTTVCEERIGRRLPIIIHGYDYPVPDGRGFLGGWGFFPGPWLEPSLRAKGYPKGIGSRKIITELIDTFNQMLLDLTQGNDMSHVSYVDLRHTLKNEPQIYKNWWANELHPTRSGFLLIAERFAKAIQDSQ